MSSYTIKEMSLISRVKPHTIRIWEKRYGLLKPLRSDTNIRFYDDEQLKKLLNVKELMNAGMKISHIGKLSPNQMGAELDKVLATAYSEKVDFETIISQILISITTFDEALFEKIFSNCIAEFGLTKTYLNIIYPTLTRVGLMWSKSDIMPAQEHFLSNLIKRKLFSIIDSQPVAKKSDQTWALFLNEDEEHEIGLLFAWYILRKHRKKVIYLGAKVPYENLANVTTQCKATHLLTFLVKNTKAGEVNHLLDKLNTDFKKSTICFSGKQEMAENIPLNKKRIWVNDIQTLVGLVK